MEFFGSIVISLITGVVASVVVLISDRMLKAIVRNVNQWREKMQLTS